MLGVRYLKANPTQYVIQYRNGNVRRAGAGLAFFYYQQTSSIAVVPIGSTDVPFIFNEITQDYQPVTVQGQLTYRIANPELVASILNYTVDKAGDSYLSDDPDKLSQRLVNLAQVYTRSEVQSRDLRAALRDSDAIPAAIVAKLASSDAVAALGVKVLSVVVLAVKPTPDIARALEAEARETLLRQADNAIYERRNSAVEQERRIKENELQTETVIAERKRQMAEAELAGAIRLESERKELLATRAENTRTEADAQSYAVAASLRPLQALEAPVLQLLAMQSNEPALLVASALKEIAANAEKIGQLNITPSLLETLLSHK